MNLRIVIFLGSILICFTMILLGFVLAIERSHHATKPNKEKKHTTIRYPTQSLMLNEKSNQDDDFLSIYQVDSFLSDESLKTSLIESVRTPSIQRDKNINEELLNIGDTKIIKKKSYPIRSIIPIYSSIPMKSH